MIIYIIGKIAVFNFNLFLKGIYTYKKLEYIICFCQSLWSEKYIEFGKIVKEELKSLSLHRSNGLSLRMFEWRGNVEVNCFQV